MTGSRWGLAPLSWSTSDITAPESVAVGRELVRKNTPRGNFSASSRLLQMSPVAARAGWRAPSGEPGIPRCFSPLCSTCARGNKFTGEHFQKWGCCCQEAENPPLSSPPHPPRPTSCNGSLIQGTLDSEDAELEGPRRHGDVDSSCSAGESGRFLPPWHVHPLALSMPANAAAAPGGGGGGARWASDAHL